MIAGVKEPADDVRGLARRAGELREHARFLLRATDPGFVFFLEIRGRGVFLRATPIDVAALVREHLLERPRTVVLTSATLAVNGSFEYVRGRLGIEDAEEIRLPSEFDYRTQALLYLPRKMPDPRSPAFVSEAAREIVEILGQIVETGLEPVRMLVLVVGREINERIRVLGGRRGDGGGRTHQRGDQH